MNVDPATHAAATAARGAHYLPGGAVAVVTADSVLLISGGQDDVAWLHESVTAAGDARGVLTAAAGGRMLDLDALPDLALAHRSPAGLRVLLSGRTRCTVVEDGTTTELDGADVALLGEWGFSAAATVELSVHDAGAAEPTWPLSAGVVQADRVRWGAAAGGSTGTAASSSLSSSSSRPPAASIPAPTPAPTSAAAPAGADATLMPEEPDEQEAAAEDWDDSDMDDVEYTVGGGIDYDRMFNPTPARSVAPDLGGDTVSPAEAAALRGATTGSGPDAPGDPTDEPRTGPGPAAAGETAARLCPQNHPNPPQLSTCRLCQAPLDGPTVRIARPSLGVVRLSTGMFFDLDRPLLLGREPRVDGVDADAAPRLIVLPSPDKAISRSHLRVDIDGWSVHAVDLGSVNGTYLRRGAADEVRLMPEEPKMLMAGDILVVDDVRVRFEDLP